MIEFIYLFYTIFLWTNNLKLSYEQNYKYFNPHYRNVVKYFILFKYVFQDLRQNYDNEDTYLPELNDLKMT